MGRALIIPALLAVGLAVGMRPAYAVTSTTEWPSEREQRSMQIETSIRSTRTEALVLEGLTDLASRQGRPRDAASLLATAKQRRHHIDRLSAEWVTISTLSGLATPTADFIGSPIVTRESSPTSAQIRQSAIDPTLPVLLPLKPVTVGLTARKSNPKPLGIAPDSSIRIAVLPAFLCLVLLRMQGWRRVAREQIARIETALRNSRLALLRRHRPSACKQLRVVIADDSPTCRALFEGLLTANEGAIVVGQAGNGWEAVQLVESLRPDFVLMDVLMPSLDGFAAATEIRERTSLPVILVSANVDATDPAMIRRAHEVGAVGFIEKPVGHFDDPTTAQNFISGVWRILAENTGLISPVLPQRRHNDPRGIRPNTAILSHGGLIR